jgi:hypothetical protein
VLHDVDHRTSLDLFDESRGGALSIHVLSGDRIVAQQGDTVLVFDDPSARPRRVFPLATGERRADLGSSGR